MSDGFHDFHVMQQIILVTTIEANIKAARINNLYYDF